jgi:hypothetical protein
MMDRLFHARRRLLLENLALRQQPAARGSVQLEPSPPIGAELPVSRFVATKLVGAVGVEPTTNGLKDPQTARQLQTNTVTYKRISGA